jgi:hypothetical protein
MATTIIDKREKNSTQVVLSIGDWIYLTNEDGDTFLCVLAQVEAGMAGVIAVSKYDANRYCKPFPFQGHNCVTIPNELLSRGCSVERVNTTITITTK